MEILIKIKEDEDEDMLNKNVKNFIDTKENEIYNSYINKLVDFLKS